MRIPIHNDLTGITGKNDAGKSSILEALDIFFEGGTVTIDRDDFNVSMPDEPVEIRCVFDELPARILLDDSSETSLGTEHLLNKDGELEILKRYKSGAKAPNVFVVCEHPSSDDFKDLHSLKITELKKRGARLEVQEADILDARRSGDWRKAIWEKAGNLAKETTELEIGNFALESKTLQEKLFRQLPVFALFRSDTENRDNDPHAKTPLQAAVKQAQEELREEIDRIAQEIQRRVMERAERTLEKLNEMDSSLAKTLSPRFKKTPTWSFDFTLDGDDGIPINKRGSGVRRLILLNFFRAEAERKVSEKGAPSAIYALEEPETSQHPSNQEVLVNALNGISSRQHSQVLVTTHVPGLAGLLPVDGLRLVESSPTGVSVSFGEDEVINRIAQSLGLLVDPRATRAKALILVEGPADIVFLRHTSEQLKAGGYISATLEERGILPLSIGGCDALNHWITKRIADQFNIPWGILLDSDIGDAREKNKEPINDLKAKGKKAYLTRKREIENYILPEVVLPHCKDDDAPSWTHTCDAKAIIGKATGRRLAEVTEFFWTKMSVDQIRRAEKYVNNGEERFEFTEMISDFLQLA